MRKSSAFRFAALFALSFLMFSFTKDKPAYLLFSKDGKPADYQAMLKKASEADVVFFGELHDNPICHWLQLELTKDVFSAKNGKLILGAEMFESDDQLILNEYLRGKVSVKTYKDEAKLWPNNETDYQPLVNFAKDKKIPFIATNVPRRYANLVYSKGLAQLDSLEKEAYMYLPPLPIKYDGELKCYKDMMAMGMGHGGDNLPKSQALKDATMAHFLLKNFSKGNTFIHYNGAYHSNNFQGIVWYLKQQDPSLKIVTISSVEQENISALEKESVDLADFILVTPATMCKTQK